eukprot:jgi/Galph1/3734/GphlegSOOS_G2386.1
MSQLSRTDNIQKQIQNLKETIHNALETEDWYGYNIEDQFASICKEISENQSFLASYDLRRCNENLKQVEAEIQQAKRKLLPKNRFRWKSKVSNDKKPREESTQRKTDNLLVNTVLAVENPQLCLENRTSEQNDTKSPFTLPSDKSGCDILLRNCTKCSWYFTGWSVVCRMKYLRDCTIFVGPVQTTAYIECCSDCTIVIAAQQVRIHDCHRCAFRVLSKQGSILERCSDILFGPYNYFYPKLEVGRFSTGRFGMQPRQLEASTRFSGLVQPRFDKLETNDRRLKRMRCQDLCHFISAQLVIGKPKNNLVTKIVSWKYQQYRKLQRVALTSSLGENKKNTTMLTNTEPMVFCYGGASAFGGEITRRFSEAGNGVVSVDSAEGSRQCTESVCFPPGAPCKAQVDIATRTLENNGLANHRFSLMVNASLGWTRGSILDDDLFDSVDFMHRSNVETSLVLAKLATRFLAPGGLLVFMGSAVALVPTPDMIAYGLAKAAIHQLVMDLSAEVGRALPPECSVIGLVPVVLDTPFHRAENNGQAGEDWTPCDVIAEKLWEWSGQKSRPKNGSLVSVTTHLTRNENGNMERNTLFRVMKTDNFVQTSLL